MLFHLSIKTIFMAEMIDNARRSSASRRSTKVDLTPMVDLGFLLITFFVFTSQLAENKAMRIAVPADGDGTKAPESGAVTLIPTDKNIWYYEGNIPSNIAEMHTIAYSDKSVLRNKLICLKNALIKQNGNDDKLVVMIKPAASANFGYVVDMLDEMTICNVKRYAVVDIQPDENKLIAAQ
jgi:biopolymer transport protein ExbD